MRKIVKYLIPLKDIQRIDLPVGSELMTINAQIPYQSNAAGETLLSLYALVNPRIEEAEQVELRILGAGPEFPDHASWKYWTTIVQDAGMRILVWHVFLRPDARKV